jgi:hypothetical protein
VLSIKLRDSILLSANLSPVIVPSTINDPVINASENKFVVNVFAAIRSPLIEPISIFSPVIVWAIIFTFDIAFAAILLPSIAPSANLSLVTAPSAILSVVTEFGANFIAVIAPSTIFCVFTDNERFKLNWTFDQVALNVFTAIGTIVAINMSPSFTTTFPSPLISNGSKYCVIVYVADPLVAVVVVVGVESIVASPSTTI